MWNFIAEEDPRDPYSFKALTKFQKERKQVVVLSLIQDSIDYSIFHYIEEADTPKRAWDILKEVFSEEPTTEDDDFASHAKHQEDSQEDCVFEAVSDQISPTKIVGPVMFVDDSEIKLVNIAMSSDVSDNLSKQ